MRFLLAVPKLISRKGRFYDFPLGIAYVSSALKQAGHDVHCLNLNHGDEPPDEAIADAVRKVDPDVFATGGLSPHFDRIAAMLEAARRAKPTVINLIGGGVISADPEAVAPLLDMDVGVVGEGEETVVELARALEDGRDLSTVRGLVHRAADGGWSQTPGRDPIRDLDRLPWADYEGFGVGQLLESDPANDDYLQNLRDDARCLPVLSSRCCPFACTFCYHPMGRIYRERGLDDFFAELDHLIDRFGINQIMILDELFSLKKDRLRAFCERIRPYGIQWMAQLHVSVVDPETIARMRDSGFVFASYGLESMSDPVLASMKKKTKPADVAEALRVTRDAGIGIQGNFIFGDPAETLDTINETMAWWARHPEYGVNLSCLQVYPGSEVYDVALERGLIASRGEVIRGRTRVNFMDLDDGHFDALMARLEVYRATTRIPARLLSFEDREGDGGRRFAAVRWVCPSCGEESHLDRVPLDSPMLFQMVGVVCRSCRNRNVVPNRSRTPWRDERLEAHYRDAREARDSGRTDEAVALYRDLTRLDFGAAQLDRPEAVIQAHLDLGMLYLTLKWDAGATVATIGEALYRRAFDPRVHALYASVLAVEGSTGGARLHLRQARLLADLDGTELTDHLDGLERAVAEAEAKFGRDIYVT